MTLLCSSQTPPMAPISLREKSHVFTMISWPYTVTTTSTHSLPLGPHLLSSPMLDSSLGTLAPSNMPDAPRLSTTAGPYTCTLFSPSYLAWVVSSTHTSLSSTINFSCGLPGSLYLKLLPTHPHFLSLFSASFFSKALPPFHVPSIFLISFLHCLSPLLESELQEFKNFLFRSQLHSSYLEQYIHRSSIIIVKWKNESGSLRVSNGNWLWRV